MSRRNEMAGGGENGEYDAGTGTGTEFCQRGLRGAGYFKTLEQ